MSNLLNNGNEKQSKQVIFKSFLERSIILE